MNMVQTAAIKYKLSLSMIKELDEGITEAIENNDVQQVNNLCNMIHYYYTHPVLVDENAYNYILVDMNWF